VNISKVQIAMDNEMEIPNSLCFGECLKSEKKSRNNPCG
jgi:hypothetical protein